MGTEARFVNLTPHAVNIVNGPSFPPSGQVARCSMITHHRGEIGGIPVAQRQMGPVEGLPDPEEGVFYIVSAMVREAAEDDGRRDCLSPGVLLRDDDGNIVGCHDLQCGDVMLRFPDTPR